jgi:signal transduction histidine kinase
MQPMPPVPPATPARADASPATPAADLARAQEELHDETLQGLAGLQLLLAGAHRASTEPDARRIIGEAIDAAARQVDALRALITEMRPLGLDELGLQTAIDELVTRFRRRTGVTTTVTVSLAYERGDAPDRLDADIETAAYRIVQEALTNVDRHAAATTVDVSVVERGELSIRVRDDGIGFGPRPGPGGFGLTGMRERADLVGGRLHVTSDDAHTTVEAQLPAVHGDGALSLLGQTDA